MIKTVLLDLDDTILDFHKAEFEALKKTLTRFSVEPTEQVTSRYSEINRAQWEALERGELTREQVKYRRFALLFEELKIDVDAEEVRKYYEKMLGIGHFFLPHAEQMLDELKGSYRLFIVSNGTTAVQQGRIESAHLAPLFEAIFLSEEVGYVKPQKEFFDVCFAQIKDFDPSFAIIVGDSLTSDIQGGINAGIRTCWFDLRGKGNHTDIHPDYTITSLEQLAPLLERI